MWQCLKYGHSYDKLCIVSQGIATIEATEAATLVKYLGIQVKQAWVLAPFLNK